MLVMRSETSSLIDLVVRRVTTRGGDRAYTFLECGEQDCGHLTWADLHRRSCAIAAAIQDRVSRGSRVLLLFPPGLDFVAAFFGSVYAGTIAVPAYPPSGARADAAAARLRGTIADAGITLVVTLSPVFARAAAAAALVPELRNCQWLNVDEIADRGDGWRRPDVGPDDLAFLQYTSGSTSSPRGVMVSHGNLLHNLACTARLGGHDERSVSVSWLPVNHDMGLIQGVLQPAFSGFPAWLMAPAAFLQRPARWLEAISRLRGTHSGAPNFAYDLAVRRVTNNERAALDLRSWRIAFNGSEPVRHATLTNFHRRFAPCGFRWNAFRPAYGLAESTLLVTASAPDTGPFVVTVDEAAFRRGVVVAQRPRHEVGIPEGLTLVACGTPDAEVRVEIVDPIGRVRVPLNEVGEIWTSSPSVARGYWQKSSETAETFGAFLASGEGPFLRTGDLGFVRDGLLFVTGRIKDVLIVRGLKHYPQDLERTVERLDSALRPGGCAVFSIDADERIGAMAEIDGRNHSDDKSFTFDHLIRAIRTAVAEIHGIQLSAVALLPPGTLPKTTSGKLRRYACREGLGSGSLPVLALWTGDGLSLGAHGERLAS